MWEQIRVLAGEGAGAERLVAMDFERSPINALDATFPYAAVDGCYFYLGQAVYRRAQAIGLASKFGSDGESKMRVEKLSALAPPPPRVCGRGV